MMDLNSKIFSLLTVILFTFVASTEGQLKLGADCKDASPAWKCRFFVKHGKCDTKGDECQLSCGICTTETGQEYVPGEPGAQWTEEEVRVARLKILALLRSDAQSRMDMKMFGKDARTVNEMGIFRLAFHDCLPYTDGPGVCDGCLDWHNMGNKAPSPFESVDTYCQHQHPKVNATDNNGLAYLVEFLEKIYTTTDFPPGAPELEVSLKSSGKSRADFWQFAANVALERTVERSNFACRHDYYQRQQVPLLENDGKGFAFGVWKCKIKLNKPFKFQFGRADCKVSNPDKPYISDRAELHSDPHANIGEILNDMKTQLGMSAKDFIALNSIHGMISPFTDASIGTKYTWMGSGPYLSNIYYKILANRPTYHVGGSTGFDIKSSQAHNLNPYSIGDKNGNPVAMWGMRVSCSDCWNTTQSWAGGPCHWRPTMPTADDCPNREKVMKDCYGKWENGKRQTRSNGAFARLCKDVDFSPEGIQIGDATTIHIDKNPRGTGGWSNMFMLNYEAGMYKKFDIDDVAMRGTGCEGINLQNPDEMWTDGWDVMEANAVKVSRVNQCPKQDLEDETGKPIYEIVEAFADDHDDWAEAFLEAFPRMQSIGYSGLEDGPENSWLGYYPLEDMGADLGNDFAGYIEKERPLVFTKENVDPYVCSNGPTSCSYKMSEIFEVAQFPMEANGPSCDTVQECNDPTFGDLTE